MKSSFSARPRVEQLEERAVPSVTVRLDYTYDTAGFFNDPTRRAALERATESIASKVYDDLAPIQPGGVNSWKANFYNPVTQSTVVLDNPTIRGGEILVFVAAAPLGSGGELGLTTTGGFTATGSRSWLDNVRSRGQVGVLANPKSDFSTWGGMITFDSQVNWSFSTTTPALDQFDFESVALHEMMHIFGFGLGEPAFTRHVVNGQFVGPTVQFVNGGPVSVVGNPPDHWAPGTSYAGEPSPLQPSLRPGERRELSALDFAALNDMGWEIYTVPGLNTGPGPLQPTTTNSLLGPSPTSSPVLAGSVQQVSRAPAVPVSGRFTVGSSAGVSVYGPSGETLLSTFPFGTDYTAGVRVASGDLTGDGIPEVIAGTGPGSSSLVRIIDGATATVIAQINPFEPSFTGGVYVAAGDFTGDGRAEVVVSADQFGGPVVVLYDGAALAQGRIVELNRFLAINDPNFRGGARIATGDINGDQIADLVVSAGYGGGPRIATYDGRSLRGTPVPLFPDFFAFEPGLRNGAFVAVADLDSDGRADIIVGAGPGGAPRVTGFSGRELIENRLVILANFFAGGTELRGGVRVASVDLSSNGQPDLIVGSGEGSTRVLSYQRGELVKPNPIAALTFNTPGDPNLGIFVG